tara:strand:+ start:2340 stop:3251 length:912 start_codon:yes stop_codon:yes gene_type:complete
MLNSIISPVYNAEGIVKRLIHEIQNVCNDEKIDYEVILVDDRSKDKSWNVIAEECQKVSNIKGIRLSRNFGQHAAITAGVSIAKGDYIIIMDCDLQDNPKYIPDLIRKAKLGYNVVCTLKKTKNHSYFRKLSSKFFFFLINLLSDINLEKNLGTMTLIDKKISKEFLKIKDLHRHTSILFKRIGFERGFINVEHDDRLIGKSSYNTRKLISHAINGIISNSKTLLNFSIYFGLSLVLISIVMIIILIIKSTTIDFVIGWPSLIVTILFSTGLVLFMLGIQGLYTGKIFEQSKDSPIYIIDQHI